MKTKLIKEEIIYYKKVYDDLYAKFGTNPFTFEQGDDQLMDTKSVERRDLAGRVGDTGIEVGMFNDVIRNMISFKWINQNASSGFIVLVPFDEILNSVDTLTTLI